MRRKDTKEAPECECLVTVLLVRFNNRRNTAQNASRALLDVPVDHHLLDPQVLGAPGVPNGVETDHRRHPMPPRRAFDVWGFRGGQGGTRGVSGAVVVVGGSAA